MRFMRQEEALKAMDLFEGAQEQNRVSKRALKNWVVMILTRLLLLSSISVRIFLITAADSRCRVGSVGKRVQRAQGTCPDAQRHQDRSEQAPPNGQRRGRVDRARPLASHPRDRNVKVLRPAELAASRGGLHVRQHSQDHLRGDRVLVRDASFRCRRSMRG